MPSLGSISSASFEFSQLFFRSPCQLFSRHGVKEHIEYPFLFPPQVVFYDFFEIFSIKSRNGTANQPDVLVCHGLTGYEENAKNDGKNAWS